MRAYYPDDFLGPPVLNLAPKAVTHLFAEFDQIAEELRRDPMFVTGDLQIAFRQLQKLRLPNLSRDEWLWLFEIWYDHDHAQQEIDVAKRAARLADLCAEREALFSARALYPWRRDAVMARLAEIGRELVELQIRT